MTILQIQYAIACEITGSMSKAAQGQYTTSSNLSKIIKSLEDELGFPIFYRTTSGVEPTPSGKKFLIHAHAIMTECKRINSLNDNQKNFHRFSCASQPNTFTTKAFTKFCQKYCNEGTHMFSIYQGDLSDCVSRVIRNASDIAILEIHEKEEINNLKRYGVNMLLLKNVVPWLYLRKDHPALAGYSEGDPFKIEALCNYPYIVYINNNENDIFPNYRTYNQNSINPSKLIYCNNMGMRTHLVMSTNAYAIGIDDLGNDANDLLIRIPITNCTFPIYCISSPDWPLSKDDKEFIELLRAELDLI